MKVFSGIGQYDFASLSGLIMNALLIKARVSFEVVAYIYILLIHMCVDMFQVCRSSSTRMA